MKRSIFGMGTSGKPAISRRSLLTAAMITLAGTTVLAKPGPPAPKPGLPATDDYTRTNLVSDEPGMALLTDTNLVNAWGISFSSSSPFWVSDNGSGLATVYSVTYDTNGVVSVVKAGLQVTIPGDGTPTGQAFNTTTRFHTNVFLFVSEDGTISGWRPALGMTAEVLVPGISNNVYKGMTLTTNGSGPVLLAANFRNGTVDEYDGDLNLLGQFADNRAPAGYAPFNVQSLEGIVYVTFAKQDAAKHDDVAGRGHGLIDVFNPSTGKFRRFATGSAAWGFLPEINSPWGLAIAPSTFGRHADQLLVGNFGSGTIMAFEANGDFKGLLEDANTRERPMVIDGLWGLAFGNGGKAGRPSTLYFSAGPDGESHGLFGAIDPAPEEIHHPYWGW